MRKVNREPALTFVTAVALCLGSHGLLAQTTTIGFDDFGPAAVLIDFEGLSGGLEGATFGPVTFFTYNNDDGSFLVEPGNSNFPAHSGSKLAIKGDGWNSEGGSNWPPPTIGAVFSTPVAAAGAWVTSPSQLFLTVLDAEGNTLATTTLDPIWPRVPRFIGFASSTGISMVLIGNNQIGGLGFDDFIYEQVLEVDIDIKPGSDPNCFNINGHGVIPVAILGTADFDVYDIDFLTLSFAGLDVRVRGSMGPLCSTEYSNDDPYLDLVCHFEDDPGSWVAGGDSAEINGALWDGTPILGSDSICIVP